MQFIKQTLVKIDSLYAYPIVLMALFGTWFERNERDASRTLVWILVFVALSYCNIFYRRFMAHLLFHCANGNFCGNSNTEVICLA